MTNSSRNEGQNTAVVVAEN